VVVFFWSPVLVSVSVSVDVVVFLSVSPSLSVSVVLVVVVFSVFFFSPQPIENGVTSANAIKMAMNFFIAKPLYRGSKNSQNAWRNAPLSSAKFAGLEQLPS
jgi:hypothetical protein